MVERGEKESHTPCKVQDPGVRPYLSRTYLEIKFTIYYRNKSQTFRLTVQSYCISFVKKYI